MKKNVVDHKEYIMHQYAYKLNIVVNIPQIIEYDQEKKILVL